MGPVIKLETEYNMVSSVKMGRKQAKAPNFIVELLWQLGLNVRSHLK